MAESKPNTIMERFPFADSSAIVRAHQKDSYFESLIKSKIQEVVQIYRGQRFVNMHPDEISIFAKLLYLALTTLKGSKTLGEEYTDLIYVNRKGTRLPRFYQKLGFVLSYLILPYAISKLISKLLKLADDDDLEKPHDSITTKIIKLLSKSNYKTTLDTLLNLHVAMFYLSGKYYQFSKRIFGLRYVFGHSVNSETNNGSYEVLGALIVVQFLFKAINKLNELTGSDSDSEDEDPVLAQSADYSQVLYGANQKTDSKEIDLSDPKSLPFIPEASRKCMLCLEYMKAPSLASCGHCFCWRCIIDWSKERPECPLCRQQFYQQQVITLK